MVKVTASFELTKAKMDALEFEAKAENMTTEELVAWMVRQNIPALLDVLEGVPEDQRKKLMDTLIDEEDEEAVKLDYR